MRLIQKSFALLDKLGSRSDPRVQMSLLLIWTHSLRAKYFSRRTRRREKWIGLDSRPASRELCEAHNGPRRAA